MKVYGQAAHICYHAHVSLPYNIIVILHLQLHDGSIFCFMSGMDNPRMILLEAEDEEAFHGQMGELWFLKNCALGTGRRAVLVG